jgi:hypothetical protein
VGRSSEGLNAQLEKLDAQEVMPASGGLWGQYSSGGYFGRGPMLTSKSPHGALNLLHKTATDW